MITDAFFMREHVHINEGYKGHPDMLFSIRFLVFFWVNPYCAGAELKPRVIKTDQLAA